MSWEDADWVPPALSAAAADEDEENYEAPSGPPPSTAADAIAEAADERPVLLLRLSLMAEQLGGAVDLGELREQVIASLRPNFFSRSAQLFANGLCEHARRWNCETERERLETEAPNLVITIIEYPEDESAPLWRSVCAPSGWEVVDELKAIIAEAPRDLRWKADLCGEIEDMAEREYSFAERRAAANARLADASMRAPRTVARGRRAAIKRAEEADDEGDLSGDDEYDYYDPEVDQEAVLSFEPLSTHEGRVVLDEIEHLEREMGPSAHEGEISSLELILTMVLQRPKAEGASPPPPERMRARLDEGALIMRECCMMWESTFGRLAAPTDLAMKHAPLACRQRVALAAGRAVDEAEVRGRLRVPLPPPCARPPPTQWEGVYLTPDQLMSRANGTRTESSAGLPQLKRIIG